MLIRFAAAAVVCYALLALPATAQTEFISHKRAARKSLKEARKYKAPDDVRQSHLAVSKRDLRPGESPQRDQVEGARGYQFDRSGTARVSDRKMVTATRRTRKQAKPVK